MVDLTDGCYSGGDSQEGTKIKMLENPRCPEIVFFNLKVFIEE